MNVRAIASHQATKVATSVKTSLHASLQPLSTRNDNCDVIDQRRSISHVMGMATLKIHFVQVHIHEESTAKYQFHPKSQFCNSVSVLVSHGGRRDLPHASRQMWINMAMQQKCLLSQSAPFCLKEKWNSGGSTPGLMTWYRTAIQVDSSWTGRV